MSLPSGTVTFLFTDIEGSTKLWESHPEAMRHGLARHDALAASIIAQHEGTLVKSRGEGDSLFAVFARATDAVAAACALQQALVKEPWSAQMPLRVRMALHTGEAELREGDYYGGAVNRCVRLRAIAHGGQVLLSGVTQELVGTSLPPGASLHDLGEHRLRDLERPERVFGLLHPDLPSEFPPLRSPDTILSNLPVQVTSFVGRQEEMAEVKALLAKTRLLTLTGSGGVGKTRLALEVAASESDRYVDGVWLVELAPLADPALVPQVLASALGVREEPGRPLIQTLVDYMKMRTLLLALDNCEHLLSACATLADAVIRHCPRVRILATSREALRIAGETPWRVPSLSLPDPKQLPPTGGLMQYEAVKLFIERATTVQPAFAVTSANAPALVQVCRRLDGIPLAIELAAARVRALPVEQIAARLDDRFRLLTGGSRTALPRQQTLRALIDWSYDLLSDQERTLLLRLSVFVGGWTLEAAEAVCSDGPVEKREVLDLLTALVDRSLVVYEEPGTHEVGGGQARYRLLETVRQYARDRLVEQGDAETARGRHLRFFLGLAEQAEPKLTGPKYAQRLKWLETEHDNLRAALEWSQGGEDGAEAGLRLSVALWLFWDLRGYLSEGRRWLESALRRSSGVTPSLRAKALAAAGHLAWAQSDYPAAGALLQESLTIARELRDKAGVASALYSLGNVFFAQGEYAQARSLYEESLAINREIGKKKAIASALTGLANVAFVQGDYVRGRALKRESLAINRKVGNRKGEAYDLHSLGEVAFFRGDWTLARSLLGRGLAAYRQIGYKRGTADVLCLLGNLHCDQGDHAAARPHHEEAFAIHREMQDRRGIAYSLEGLAYLALARSQFARAARLFGAADALREAMHVPVQPHERAHHDAKVAAMRAALGEEAFAAARTEGRAMTLEQAVKYALEHEGG